CRLMLRTTASAISVELCFLLIFDPFSLSISQKHHLNNTPLAVQLVLTGYNAIIKKEDNANVIIDTYPIDLL
ncbi:MAG: hypothetical protein KDI13_01920, partial [Alphaproteobacteria bacterium]|nr:hypothetical protein [Alphaproteobacteria bacterium]